MKNKIMAMLVAFGLVGSVSAIEINENLSINGFIDGSFSSTDTRIGGASSDTTDIGLDEIELNFLFSAGGVSGELHLDSNDAARDNDNEDLDIEQAHLSYGFEGGLSLTAGIFGSALGFEREDPGGLYTFSRAYSEDGGFNLGDVDSYQQEGLRLSYASDQFSVSLTAFNGLNAFEETAGNPGSEDDLDWELAIAFTGIENLALGGGVQTNNETNLVTIPAGPADTTIINIHGAYTMGKALIGAEWSNIDADNTTAPDRDAYQIVVDYDVSDVLGFAVRYAEEDSVTAGENIDSVTIAPNYAISDNLGAILEYSNINHGDESDEDYLAVELTFTF
jgi:hypothetical protein